MTAADRPARERLVGTWRFVKYVNTDATGQATYPFGETPSGFIVWDNTGHVFVQVARPPDLAAFSAGRDLDGTDSEVRAAFERYDAYFGTYTVDEMQHVVVHRVLTTLRPSYAGTEQRRPFRFQSDSTLILEFSFRGSSFYRELQRMTGAREGMHPH